VQLHKGWISIRKERKHLMTGFLVIAFIFLVCWLAMFKARTYRWTFIEWPFLVCMTLVSYITIVGSFIFGIMSWLNFGKGFSSYRKRPLTHMFHVLTPRLEQ
jgi:cell division protein FtsW (lipid II flippase)